MITGAASGIGRATALRALAHDARVTSLDIVDPQINGVTHISCDVSSHEDWTRTADQVGVPDHLFLNAGIMSAPPAVSAEAYAFFNVTLESYRKITGVNVDGVVFGLWALAPRMAPGSSIVVNSSLAGVHPYAHDPIYAMTKHALVGLTKSLAPSLTTQSIRLNALCLNRVDTPMLPAEMRSRDRLSVEVVAADVLHLFAIPSTGGVWGRTHEDQPLYPIGGSGPPSWRGALNALRRRIPSLRR